MFFLFFRFVIFLFYIIFRNNLIESVYFRWRVRFFVFLFFKFFFLKLNNIINENIFICVIKSKNRFSNLRIHLGQIFFCHHILLVIIICRSKETIFLKFVGFFFYFINLFVFKIKFPLIMRHRFSSYHHIVVRLIRITWWR